MGRVKGPGLLRALRHRNYRLFFMGQGVSLIGTWMTRLATAWLVWQLTHSPAMLGLVGFAGQVPSFLLGPFAGVWADRLHRQRLLIITQVLAMLQSFALAGLTIGGVITVAEVLVLQAFQGVVNAFEVPTRQALLVELIGDRADLANAVALNSSMVNAARLVGPSLAGVIIAAVGEGWVFFADGVSYMAVIASLLAIRILRRAHPTVRKRLMQELHDGLRYAFGFTPIRAILLLLGLLSMAGAPYTVLLPVIASRTLGGGAHTLGFLMGAMGSGALCGALYLASYRSVLGLGRLLPLAGGLFGGGLIAVGLSRSLALSLLFMAVAGVGFMVNTAASNTLIQTLVREDMRGRVMSFYAMAFMGMAPFGSLLAGGVAAYIGAADTLVVGGAVCVLGALVFATQLRRLRALSRPVYVERGILPEIASGLREATALREELGQ